MRYLRKKEVVVIAGDNATSFQDEVNDALSKLADEEIDVDLKIDTNPLTAVITYTRDISIPEDERDEYNLAGVYAYCHDCEQFNSSTDGRHKMGYCRMHSKRVRTDANACIDYYQMKSRWEK